MEDKEIKKNEPQAETERQKVDGGAEKTEKQTSAEHKTKSTKKHSETEKLKEELAAQKDLLLRTAAEYDNYKKRSEKEKLAIAEYAEAKLLKKFLPIIDNVERAKLCESGSEEYNKGIEMIIKQLFGLSDALGLVEIGKEGETFDPNFHEAVMHIEDPEKPENSIDAVLQKGYKIGNTVIRAAMVRVAN